MYACVSECVCIFCSCADTIPFKFRGVVLSYSVLWNALHVLWCCLLSEALLSTTCIWIWKPNEEKLNVTQYVWECPVGTVIDGGWNYVSTLRKFLKFGGIFCVELCLFWNKVCSNYLSGWVTWAKYAPICRLELQGAKSYKHCCSNLKKKSPLTMRLSSQVCSWAPCSALS